MTSSSPQSSVSIVIPSVGRPTLLRSVLSFLNQSSADVQVIVVMEKGSSAPSLPIDSRLSIVENQDSTGPSANRNFGLSRAENSWVAFLDDDDFFALDHIKNVLLQAKNVKEDHAWVTGLSGVSPAGELKYIRSPSSLSPKGAHWSLSPLVTWEQSLTKQSLIAPRAVLTSIAGFDETFRTRELTEIFWRLNAEVPVFGSSRATYFRTVWPKQGAVDFLDTSKTNRPGAFEQLSEKHKTLMKSHLMGFR